MNAREEWPAPEEVPQWWIDRPLTAEQLDEMAEAYAREQAEDALARAVDEAPRVDAAGTYIGENK